MEAVAEARDDDEEEDEDGYDEPEGVQEYEEETGGYDDEYDDEYEDVVYDLPTTRSISPPESPLSAASSNTSPQSSRARPRGSSYSNVRKHQRGDSETLGGLV